MADVFPINELVAANRRATMLVYAADGVTPAPSNTDFTGCVWIDQSTGVYIAATGTLVNSIKNIIFAALTFGSISGNHVTITAHGLKTGDGKVRLTTTGALPTGLAVSTNYWIIVIDVNTIAFATSLANAYAGTEITLGGSPSGTNQIIDYTTFDGTLYTQRQLDGVWDYIATQAETNFPGSHLVVLIEKTGFSRAMSHVGMNGLSSIFDAIIEGSITFGDAMRALIAIFGGPSGDYSSGSYGFKDPSTGTKTRWSNTADVTGRKTATPGDLTP